MQRTGISQEDQKIKGRFAVLVLAAGRSRRMGAQKLLLPISGKPMITKIVDEALAADMGPVIVVVGSAAHGVAHAIEGRDVQLVENPAAESEMLDSIRCGLKHLPGGCEGVMVVLGDQPGIKPELMKRLGGAAGTEKRFLIAPVCRGRRGHPVLFSMDFIPEIMDRFDDTGLKGLFTAHAQEVCALEVDDPSIFIDLDTPEDYSRLAVS